MKRAHIVFAAIILCSVMARAESGERWQLLPNGGITWPITAQNTPHSDHMEMSGEQISAIVRYDVSAQGAFHITRSLMFPMLRLAPLSKTQNHLKQRIDIDVAALVTVADANIFNEKVSNIELNGKFVVKSKYDHISGRNVVPQGVELTRTFYPSPKSTYYVEQYSFKNIGKQPLTLRLPRIDICYDTPAELGVDGAYKVEVAGSKSGWFTVAPSDSLSFHVIFSGRRADAPPFVVKSVDADRELREAQVREWWSKLILETPDPILNRMFAFAKIRGAESIYKTKGGYMHGPGGEAYYAAIWANDQAEYINPFFPFLGYDIGNESALNSFRHFARFMNDDYRPIPSSIISEGASTWQGAKDRGDGAMIAYGAARYALARGDKQIAHQLWGLIEWCLEYCNRKLTAQGVVASDSDELENRFPSGEANLCTSSLYYDALISASMLGKELGKPSSQIKRYDTQAKALKEAIESHFGSNVEGYQTYRYYDGNDVLRSWICMPLAVGIYDRAAATIDALFSPRLWTDDGLLTQSGSQTFWDRSTLYSLRGTFAAGEVNRGIDFLKQYSRRRLLGDHVPYAIEAWPEGNQRHLSAESGLYCRVYTEGLLGIRPTGLSSFELTPRLPKGWDYMNLRHIMAFGSDLDVILKRDGDKIEVVVEGRDKTYINKKISAGQTINVSLR